MQSSTAWLGTFSDISTDPRPLKARNSLLNSGFRTMELLNKNEQIVSFSRLSSWSKMLFWGSLFRIGLLKELSVRNFLDARMRKPIILNQPTSKDDLILLFDIDLLPFVTHRLPLNPVILDFREIYTEQFGQDLKFRLFLRPIRKFIIERSTKSIGASYTVSRGLVSYYENEFGLKPDVIRSVPKFQKFVSSSTSSQNIRIVYMGVAHPLRNLEKSAKMVVDSREDVEFHFYLVGDKNYIATLTRQCKNSSRIFFHPAVNFHAINETLTQYDLGWCYFIPETENLKNALPNKFFDYIQAGLGVICGPNLDMIEEDRNWGFGFFASEYSENAMNQLLVNLTADSIARAKGNAKLAKNQLTWENEENKFLEIVEKVTRK